MVKNKDKNRDSKKIENGKNIDENIEDNNEIDIQEKNYYSDMDGDSIMDSDSIMVSDNVMDMEGGSAVELSRAAGFQSKLPKPSSFSFGTREKVMNQKSSDKKRKAQSLKMRI